MMLHNKELMTLLCQYAEKEKLSTASAPQELLKNVTERLRRQNSSKKTIDEATFEKLYFFTLDLLRELKQKKYGFSQDLISSLVDNTLPMGDKNISDINNINKYFSDVDIVNNRYFSRFIDQARRLNDVISIMRDDDFTSFINKYTLHSTNVSYKNLRQLPVVLFIIILDMSAKVTDCASLIEVLQNPDTNAYFEYQKFLNDTNKEQSIIPRPPSLGRY